MKSSLSWKFTILAAAMIIAVFTWEQWEEKAAVERVGKESSGRIKMTYDGGWTRGLAMILSGAIIGIQIYTRIQSTKK